MIESLFLFDINLECMGRGCAAAALPCLRADPFLLKANIADTFCCGGIVNRHISSFTGTFDFHLRKNFFQLKFRTSNGSRCALDLNFRYLDDQDFSLCVGIDKHIARHQRCDLLVSIFDDISRILVIDERHGIDTLYCINDDGRLGMDYLFSKVFPIPL